MVRPVKRLYEDYLLNEWIKNEVNQISMVKAVYANKTGFVMKEVYGIIDSKEIPFDMNDQDNRHTNEYLNKHNEKNRHTILEKLYEKDVKDYLITARVKDLFGLGFNVNILCEVRSRYLRSPFFIGRIRDQTELCNEDIYAPEYEQLAGRKPYAMSLSDESSNKLFAPVLLTIDTGKRADDIIIRVMNGISIYKVDNSELANIANILQGRKITV